MPMLDDFMNDPIADAALCDPAWEWFWKHELLVLDMRQGSGLELVGRGNRKHRSTESTGENISWEEKRWGRARKYNDPGGTDRFGVLPEIDFAFDKKWTCITAFEIENTGDERTICGNTSPGNAFDRQLFASVSDADPGAISILSRTTGSLETFITGSTSIVVGNPYCLCISNEGTGATSDLRLVTIDLLTGDVIDDLRNTVTAFDANDEDLDENEWWLGGHFDDANDNMDGWIYAQYYFDTVLTDAQISQIGHDLFGPFRPYDWWSAALMNEQAAPAGGLSIPVAMHHYTKNIGAA